MIAPNDPTGGPDGASTPPALDRIAAALERIAAALERLPAMPAAAGSAAHDPGRFEAAMAVRRALDESRWDLAEKLLRSFSGRYGASGEADALTDEVAEARRAAVEDLRARLAAARQANDAEAAIGFRDALAPLLRDRDGSDFREEVDRPLVRWLLLLIQRRLRTGKVAPDVAALAARVSESFGDTPEGASLRASLPTLRRSAGLCPRCAEPYTGLAAACPKCLAAAASANIAPAPPVPDEPEEAPEDEVPAVDPDPFREFD